MIGNNEQTSPNKRVCGSLRSPKPPAVASHIRKTLGEMLTSGQKYKKGN